MLDLTEVTAALSANAPSLAQVIQPEHMDTQGVDSAVKLLSLIGTPASNRVYPLVLPEEPTFPAVAYAQDAAERIEVDGYPILRDDGYQLAVLASTHSAAATLADSLRVALLAYDPSGTTGAADITDQGDSYDEDLQLFEIGLSVRLSHLARTTQTLPVAFVYPLSESWEQDDSITCITGTAVSTFAVLLVAKLPAGGVSGLGSLRDEILSAVVALEPTGWGEIEPAGGGEVVEVHNSLVLWRDTFSARQTRTYS